MVLTVSRKLVYPLFFFIMSFFSFSNRVLAGNVTLPDFPDQLADATNMPLFASQVLVSVIFTFAFLLALNATKKGSGVLPNLIVGLGCLCFCVAIGWLDYWILLLICLIISAIWSGKIADWIGRRT